MLVTVFAHHPLRDAEDPELVSARTEARETLLELARAEGLELAEARFITGSCAARELQRVTEEPETGLIVVGSTTRGPVGRLLIGGVGERLLAGGACPVAIAPHGYSKREASGLRIIGVGLDGSQEARLALDAAVALATTCGARIRVITVFTRRRGSAVRRRGRFQARLLGPREATGGPNGPAGGSRSAESRSRGSVGDAPAGWEVGIEPEPGATLAPVRPGLRRSALRPDASRARRAADHRHAARDAV